MLAALFKGDRKRGELRDDHPVNPELTDSR
jgi:hypothetical protein